MHIALQVSKELSVGYHGMLHGLCEPALVLCPGRLINVDVPMYTTFGCLNVPNRFLPIFMSTAVFPQIDESACAISVVGF